MKIFLALKLKNATAHNPLVVISASSVSELKAIERSDAGVLFGAGTSMNELNDYLTDLLTHISGERFESHNNEYCLFLLMIFF